MRFSIRILAAVLLAAMGTTYTAQGQEYYVDGGNELFANQYTQGAANQATAQIYVSPVPVPEWVGHTYYTYQPFYPHEMMHAHSQRYHSYYDNGRGLNSTRVRYSIAPLKGVIGNFTPFMARPQ
jgi:hypothetical protein